jgi:hypothetical protein
MVVDMALVPVAVAVPLRVNLVEEEVAALIPMPILVSLDSEYHRLTMEETVLMILHKEQARQVCYFYR